MDKIKQRIWPKLIVVFILSIASIFMITKTVYASSQQLLINEGISKTSVCYMEVNDFKEQFTYFSLETGSDDIELIKSKYLEKYWEEKGQRCNDGLSKASINPYTWLLLGLIIMLVGSVILDECTGDSHK